jgi:predicted alpha/beta-hydrolase family hydrolase
MANLGKGTGFPTKTPVLSEYPGQVWLDTISGKFSVARGPSDIVEPLTLEIEGGRRVSARLELPAKARACFVLAHSAGAGMDHPFMSAAARELGALGIGTLRFQFPYMEQHSRRPDPPPVCHATVRAAVAEAARRAHGLPLLAGGRSFGGRMSSQAQALSPLAHVRALVFLGFPLHPAGAPSDSRARHLFDVQLPMLFIQGSRDALAERSLLEPIVTRLGPRATLHVVDDADHTFHVPARTGRSDAEVRNALWPVLSEWLDSLP